MAGVGQKLIVVAIGGNALLRRGEQPDAETERHNLSEATRNIALLCANRPLIVTHGNGPQIGFLALEAGTRSLDQLGAESEALIGYQLEQELGNQLPGRDLATLLTQVVVSPDDPAFRAPTKPIGPIYSEAEARRISGQQAWNFVKDGAGYRRAVPSPRPRRIVEERAIRVLLDAGVVVICAGGGGIPVTETTDGKLQGIEAVIDKDYSAALLADALGASTLLLLTDVEAVMSGWGTEEACPIRDATPEKLRSLKFEAGTMGPKVEAACYFVETTGGVAGIGALTDAVAIAEGRAGTLIQTGRS